MEITNVEDIQKICGDGILVKQIKDESTRASGLVVPETVIEKRATRRRSAWKAEVVKVGNGVDHEWLNCGTKVGEVEELKAGDKIFVAAVALDCPSFVIDESIYRIIKDDDVLAMEVV